MHDSLTSRLGVLSTLLGLSSLALFTVSVWGFRAGGWPWLKAYDLAGWGAWTAGAGVIVALAALLRWMLSRRGGALVALLGLILSLPIAGLGTVFEIAARTTPPINDISTDIEDPPVFWFTVTPSDYPTLNGEPQLAAYPDVRPLELPLSVDDAFETVRALVEARGWEVLSADPTEDQLEAIARSHLFGFEDEVAIRVTETEVGTRLDMRSRSRLGQIDRGANARRIEAFFTDLKLKTGE